MQEFILYVQANSSIEGLIEKIEKGRRGGNEVVIIQNYDLLLARFQILDDVISELFEIIIGVSLYQCQGHADFIYYRGENYQTQFHLRMHPFLYNLLIRLFDQSKYVGFPWMEQISGGRFIVRKCGKTKWIKLENPHKYSLFERFIAVSTVLLFDMLMFNENKNPRSTFKQKAFSGKSYFSTPFTA